MNSSVIPIEKMEMTAWKAINLRPRLSGHGTLGIMPQNPFQMQFYVKTDVDSKGTRSSTVDCRAPCTTYSCFFCTLLMALPFCLVFFMILCVEQNKVNTSYLFVNGTQEHPKLLITAAITKATIKECDEGWTEYNGSCYKHFDTPEERVVLPEIRVRCAEFGGDIATGATKGEREFMEKMNRPSFNDRFYYFGPFGQQMLVGIIQDHFNQWVSINSNETLEQPIPWCGARVYQQEPNQWRGIEHCVIHHTFENDEFCYHDIECKGDVIEPPLGFRRYMCKKPMN